MPRTTSENYIENLAENYLVPSPFVTPNNRRPDSSVNFAVDYLETDSIVNFAVDYSDGVQGKVHGMVEIGLVLGKVLDVAFLSPERVNRFQDGTLREASPSTEHQ